MANGSPRGIPHLPLDPRRPVVNLWRVTPHPIRISAAGVTALVAVIGWLVYRQQLDLPAVLGISLIIAGTIVLNLFSKVAAHS